MKKRAAQNNNAWLSLVKKSRNALIHGKNRFGISGYRKIVAGWKNCPSDVLLDAARAFRLAGEREEASSVLRRVGEMDELSDAFTLRYAAEWYGTGNYVKTAEILTVAYERFGADMFLIPLAEVRERLGETDLAMAALDSMKNETARAHLVRGLLIVRNGDSEGALPSFLEAYQQGQRSMDMLTASRAGLEAARCYEKQGESQTAWETMCAAKKLQFQDSALVRKFDKVNRTVHARAFKDMEEYIGYRPDELPSPDDRSPILVVGHPRSGTSVVSVALSRQLNRVQIDERSTFLNALVDRHANKLPVCKLKAKVLDSVRKDYFRRLRELEPNLTEDTPFIEKSAGDELVALRWLRVFPASRVVFIQRHPLDVLISCLFIYLNPNPVSLQHSTPERAAESILASQQIQQRLCAEFPEHFLTISYDDFTASGQIPMDGLPAPSKGEKIKGTEVNSPNYFQATQPVHKKATNRYLKYLPFLPEEVVAKLMPE